MTEISQVNEEVVVPCLRVRRFSSKHNERLIKGTLQFGLNLRSPSCNLKSLSCLKVYVVIYVDDIMIIMGQ